MSEAGGRKSELTAETETQFSMPGANIRITFVRDADNRVIQLIVNENGRESRARKIR